MNKTWTVIITAIISVIIAGGGTYYYMQKKEQVAEPAVQKNDSSSTTEGETITSESPSGYITAKVNITGASEQEVIFSKIDFSGSETELIRTPLTKKSHIQGSVSSDGRLIAYVDEDGNAKLYNTETDEDKTIKKAVPYSEEAQNVNEVLSFNDATISPDGENIALNFSGWEWSGVAMIKSDGSNYEKLDGNIDGATCQLTYFSWASDSDQYVIGSWNNDLTGDSSCLVLSSVSSPATKKNLLYEDLSKTYPDSSKDTYSPVFSPNLSKIAFGYRYMDAGSNADEKAYNYRGIYTVDVDGANFAQVSENQSFSSSPFWLDDDTIIYGLSNYYSGQNKGIYSIKLDKTDNIQILSDSYNSYEPFSISKDKNYLIYQAGDREKWNDQLSKYFLLDISTGQSEELVNVTDFVGWVY